jgi:putative hydrolase of the HAD superfamily
MARALIFDLDNCLAPSDELGRDLLEPVFTAVREANHGRLSETELAAAFEDCWVYGFDKVAERHGFSDAMREAGWRAFAGIEVRAPMRGYGDLDLLPTLGDRRFLVTSGFRRLQESKVRALGVSDAFDEVVIDAIDEPERRGKERVFQDLLAKHRLNPAEVLVVGDDPESELASARKLGLGAVQTVRPRVRAAAGLPHVRDFEELRRMLAGQGSEGAILPSDQQSSREP